MPQLRFPQVQTGTQGREWICSLGFKEGGAGSGEEQVVKSQSSPWGLRGGDSHFLREMALSPSLAASSLGPANIPLCHGVSLDFLSAIEEVT